MKATRGSGVDKFAVAYFTASCDDAETNKKFAESLKLDYPILSDPDRKAATAFGCLNPRKMSNRWTYYVGQDGIVLHIDKKVSARTHGADVAKKLAELGVEKKE